MSRVYSNLGLRFLDRRGVGLSKREVHINRQRSTVLQAGYFEEFSITAAVIFSLCFFLFLLLHQSVYVLIQLTLWVEILFVWFPVFRGVHHGSHGEVVPEVKTQRAVSFW